MKAALAFVVIFFAAVLIGYTMLKNDELPIYKPNQINSALVDESLRHQSGAHTIGDFELTNQLGQKVTPASFEDKVYVVDFFFTTCRSICPKMTTQLTRVQKAYESNEDLMLLSHSVLPDQDSVPVLYDYAEAYGADHNKWFFVTGNQSEIFALARKNYFAILPGSNDDEQDGFVHTENVILVDKEKRIRGFYDGTSTEEIDQLIDDIEILLDSYEK